LGSGFCIYRPYASPVFELFPYFQGASSFYRFLALLADYFAAIPVSFTDSSVARATSGLARNRAVD
jgi:hypothetical protein